MDGDAGPGDACRLQTRCGGGCLTRSKSRLHEIRLPRPMVPGRFGPSVISKIPAALQNIKQRQEVAPLIENEILLEHQVAACSAALSQAVAVEKLNCRKCIPQ